MALISPFRALRFTDDAGPLDRLVAPPYDVLSEAQRNELASQSPHNIVHLTLPESQPDDRSKFVRYARSSARLAEWRRQGVLAPEPAPSVYRYTQTFEVPGFDRPLRRTKLIVLIKVEPYEKGVVLPHEQTFPKHKEDRLRLLEATRAHLESIYGLYEDDGGSIQREVDATPGTPVADVVQDGVRNQVDRISDPAAIRNLVDRLADKKVWIADGHHRFETAVNFRAALGPKPGLVAEDFMMIGLSSMADPGLIILPTHRIVHKLNVGPAELDQVFQALFHTRRVPNTELLAEVERLSRPTNRVFGVALPGGVGLLLTLEDAKDALRWVDGEGSDRLKLLDVTILHRVIFEKLLGLKGLDFFAYTRDPGEALAAVESGAGASFLMVPPSVDDMRRIALGGEKMPQKSTYYYPKLLSGLAMWSLDDFDEGLA